MDALAELMSLADEARAQAAASSRPGQLDALESIADRLLALRVRLRAELDRLTAERQAIESAVTDYADSCEHGGDLPDVVASMAQDLTRLRYTVLTERTVERDEARAEVKRLRAEVLAMADIWDGLHGQHLVRRHVVDQLRIAVHGECGAKAGLWTCGRPAGHDSDHVDRKDLVHRTDLVWRNAGNGPTDEVTRTAEAVLAAELDPETAALTRVADAIDAVLALGREVLDPKAGA